MYFTGIDLHKGSFILFNLLPPNFFARHFATSDIRLEGNITSIPLEDGGHGKQQENQPFGWVSGKIVRCSSAITVIGKVTFPLPYTKSAMDWQYLRYFHFAMICNGNVTFGGKEMLNSSFLGSLIPSTRLLSKLAIAQNR